MRLVQSMVEEENFPRGGKITQKRPPQENVSLFGFEKPPKPKKPKTSKKQDVSDDIFQSAVHVRGSLRYNQIQAGMVILGCVRNISNLALEVELPGICFALVTITEISDPFTKHLNRQLENNDPDPVDIKKLISVGDFLPVNVTNVETRENGIHVAGSINPREIYSAQNHAFFKKGMLVWACIQSHSDHGYEMTLGVKHCRAFVPFKNIDPEGHYEIGKPLWCEVHKVDSTATGSILRLSAKLEHIISLTCDVERLDSVLPGTKVNFVTERISEHGIQGKFGDHFLGYINETHLDAPLKRPSDYREGKLLSAYVLFVEPITKITHLSLRAPQNTEKPDLSIGDIVTAKVFSKANNGVAFVLPGDLKGFVTHKRLMNCIGKKDSTDIYEKINAKFSVGSKHKCRILDYSHLSQMFICSPEADVLKQSVLTANDLVPGQLVEVKIARIKEEGFVVATGGLRGFVSNLHISNSELTNNIKSKFKEGQKANARVLSVDEGRILFTMKPMLVGNDECLTRLEDAEVGKQYMGVVCKISENGALIVFYANVSGHISKMGMGQASPDPSKYFFLGQVVNVYVWRKQDTHLSLCLFRPKEKSSMPNIGEILSGIVKSIKKRGIVIQIEAMNKTGLIPNAHISASLSLCNAVKSTFRPGHQVPDLMFVGGNEPLVFSRREANFFKSDNIPRLDTLKVGELIRCSYQNRSPMGMHVRVMVRGISKPVLIRKVSIDGKIPRLVPHQLLIAKVKKLDIENKTLDLSIKLRDVFDKNVEGPLDLFTQYLQEEIFLYKFGKKKNWGICKYKSGRRVQCTVEKVASEGGCVVSLSEKIKGIVVPSLCPKKLKEGDSVPGVIVAHDYEKRVLLVCLKPDISNRINELQDGHLKAPLASCKAEKLLVKDECVICVLRDPKGNKQLVYLPLKLHENDFVGCSSNYDVKKFKICVCGKLNRFLIGMSKKLFISLDKVASKKQNKVALKLPEEGQLEEMPVENEDDELESDSEEVQSESEESDYKNGEVEVEDQDVEQHLNNVTENTLEAGSEPIVLPGVSSFFNVGKKEAVVEDSSEDEDETPTEKKKKKLSPAERADLLRKEEERIAKIERELADASRAPESAEQFDRLLLSKPDSAELWAKYIAFHIAATEIDKARAVVKRALDTINMTRTEDKFKIWMVALKLENMFGTEETFEKSLEEAAKFNDSLRVYLKVIEMFAENGKYAEMEGKISKVRAKHKQDPVMWLELGRIYYQIGQFKEARTCKDRALKSITDKKSQMTIIVRFAIMEFKYGEPDQGCAIFETILLSNPKKINIWMTYVDQLVKKNQIDEARHLLERSVCQKLPLKSMKSLFMAFRKFEEVHGTPETVEAVKQRAHEYVAAFDKLN